MLQRNKELSRHFSTPSFSSLNRNSNLRFYGSEHGLFKKENTTSIETCSSLLEEIHNTELLLSDEINKNKTHHTLSEKIMYRMLGWGITSLGLVGIVRLFKLILTLEDGAGPTLLIALIAVVAPGLQAEAFLEPHSNIKTYEDLSQSAKSKLQYVFDKIKRDIPTDNIKNIFYVLKNAEKEIYLLKDSLVKEAQVDNFKNIYLSK